MLYGEFIFLSISSIRFTPFNRFAKINVGSALSDATADKVKIVANGGGTSQGVLDALAALQTEIDNLIPSQTGNSGKFLSTNGTTLQWVGGGGGLNYQGTWNAATNTPTLTSSVGTNNNYYIVSTAGTTTLNGISLWSVGDWVIFNGTTSAWEKINGSSSEAFSSITVTGLTGYMYANGSSAVTASTTIPTSALSGQVAVTNGGTVNLASGTSSVVVVATPTDSEASVTVSGRRNLVAGSNTLTVTVTAASSSTFNVKLASAVRIPESVSAVAAPPMLPVRQMSTRWT